MSKELTEQWKNKELKDGDYYVINKAGDIVCDYYIEILGHFDSVLTENVKEVLAPVPSYTELCELKQELEICKDEKADLYAKLCNALMQLEEANKVLSGLITPQTQSLEPVTNYLEKWGVK